MKPNLVLLGLLTTIGVVMWVVVALLVLRFCAPSLSDPVRFGIAGGTCPVGLFSLNALMRRLRRGSQARP